MSLLSANLKALLGLGAVNLAPVLTITLADGSTYRLAGGQDRLIYHIYDSWDEGHGRRVARVATGLSTLRHNEVNACRAGFLSLLPVRFRF